MNTPALIFGILFVVAANVGSWYLGWNFKMYVLIFIVSAWLISHFAVKWKLYQLALRIADVDEDARNKALRELDENDRKKVLRIIDAH